MYNTNTSLLFDLVVYKSIVKGPNEVVFDQVQYYFGRRSLVRTRVHLRNVYCSVYVYFASDVVEQFI